MIGKSNPVHSFWGLALLLFLVVFLGFTTQKSSGTSENITLFADSNQDPDPGILALVSQGIESSKAHRIKISIQTNPGEIKESGVLKVFLCDADGKTLSQNDIAFVPIDRSQNLGVKFELSQLPKWIKVEGPGGFLRNTDFAKARVVKPQEVTMNLPREVANGSEIDLRIAVRAVQSFTRTFALGGCRIEVELANGSQKVWALGTYFAAKDGILHQRVRLPELEDGEYRLVLRVGSALSGETFERPVKIKREPKILLTTDKPLYQPGQEIHMRALVLSAFDLKPAVKTTMEFEVEDGKANKVFRKTVTTTEQGIAHADFVLASEVNQGGYRIRATAQGKKSEKTVRVEPYVLPRFKLALKGDKSYYLPKETIKGTIQADYIFGKPLVGAKVKIRALTLDLTERAFQNWEGKTNDKGLATFEIALPDYLVGLPIAKGDAVVRLEAEIIDTAEHSEKTQKVFPVSEKSLKITAIPQGGHLVPGLENRIYAAVVTPDGKPVAGAEVILRKGGPVAAAKTNDSGVALLVFTPQKSDFKQGEYKMVSKEFVGIDPPFQQMGFEPTWAGQLVASLPTGEKVEIDFQTKSNPSFHGLLLQTDRAVYQPGHPMRLQVHSNSPAPSAFIDVIREGQSVMSDSVAMKDGKGELSLDLPTGASGALEVHAWQVQLNGEMIRDSRFIYAQPGNELQLRIETNRETYRPGETAELQFHLTDRLGNPKVGALGVIVVDEAVYQLQEIQPGLEKVFFTLQEELLKPQAQVLKTTDDLPELVRPPVIRDDKQLVAGALFAAFQPKAPPVHRVDQATTRNLDMYRKVGLIARALGQAVAFEETRFGKYLSLQRGHFVFAPDFLSKLVEENLIHKEVLANPLGGDLTAEDLSDFESNFTAVRFAEFISLLRMVQTEAMILQWVYRLSASGTGNLQNSQPDFTKITTESIFKASLNGKGDFVCRDIYGRFFRIEKTEKGKGMKGHPYLEGWDLVSAGADGKFGTRDDLRLSENALDSFWGIMLSFSGRTFGPQGLGTLGLQGINSNTPGAFFGFYGGSIPMDARPGGGFVFLNGGKPLVGGEKPMPGGDGVRLPDRAIAPMNAKRGLPKSEAKKGLENLNKDNFSLNLGAQGTSSPSSEPIHLREFFPETLLWQPSLITDDKGRASLKLPLADSITTWRLSASASTATGALGSAEKGFRVFQDFFVEPDLPRFLTQNDELTFSVTLFNYLDQPQTIRLKLLDSDWFERLGQSADREIQLGPNQVLGEKYTIRALKNGTFPLEIEARGTKLSDRVRRQVEVLPFGQRTEKAFTARLAGKWKETVSIPKDAVEGASSVSIKIYPGVFSQLVEGMDGILRMPGGCFEQTSSSAYPNLLVVQYIKRNGLVTPAIQAKAEAYLNAGYQRLLTFERPGGGFDWWGKDEPVLWLSAYGLMEFSDMAKVWPVDQAVIDRTRAWLLKQRAADGTWSKIGATHGESIERMGDPRLLMTSYVCWALLEAGAKPAEIKTSLDYLRKEVVHAEHPYILALAANALVRADSKDPANAALIEKVLVKLEGMRKSKPEWDASFMPVVDGQSLSYARGNGLEVETTALATLAILESGTRSQTVNQLLAYLAKSRDTHGTWGSTQATVLALKALVGASAMKQVREPVDFKILVGGKEAAQGRIHETNADLMQVFDLKSFLSPVGENEITVEANRETAMQVQIASRYYTPWKSVAKPVGAAFELKVDYDRAQLAVGDTIRAKATLKYLGKEPTAMVMLDLGIAPGFQPDPAEFEAMVQAGKLKKFSMTDRQAILYLQDVSPNRDYTFEYSLKVKYPVKAKSLPAVAWEYYTPDRRVESNPTAFEVSDAVR